MAAAATGSSAAAEPFASTDELLDRYDSWLFYERRYLCAERGRDPRFVPEDRFASMFIHPIGEDWQNLRPSRRAVTVLRAIGLTTAPDAVDPYIDPVVRLWEQHETASAGFKSGLSEYYDAHDSDPPDDSPVYERLSEAARTFVTIAHTRATTLAGCMVKARMLGMGEAGELHDFIAAAAGAPPAAGHGQFVPVNRALATGLAADLERLAAGGLA